MTKDLGTYHLRVELIDGRGWIDTWNTGWRYTHGRSDQTKLDASPIPPTYESEEGLFRNMEYMYFEGSYSCDCNKLLFLARANQEKELVDSQCGGTMPIERLTAIRPDRSEVVLYALPEQIGKEK